MMNYGYLFQFFSLSLLLHLSFQDIYRVKLRTRCSARVKNCPLKNANKTSPTKPDGENPVFEVKSFLRSQIHHQVAKLAKKANESHVVPPHDRSFNEALKNYINVSRVTIEFNLLQKKLILFKKLYYNFGSRLAPELG